MKQLKMSMVVLLIATFFSSCNEEITMSPENAIKSDASVSSARPSESVQAGELYALFAWDSSENIALYSYNPSNDAISLNEGFTGNTGQNYNFAFDYNSNDGLFYFLGAEQNNSSTPRSLYTYNRENGEVLFIDQMESVEGQISPQDLTFDDQGILYVVFKGGEINSYNITTNTMSAFSNVPQNGGVGLTYDFDHHQLLYATGGGNTSGPVSLYSIDLMEGLYNLLFSFYPPQCSNGTAHGIEYVGNNKLIATSVYGCDIIYTINLEAENTNLLLSPTGSYTGIVDLIYININNPDMDDDGVLNENDPYPNSNMSETISLGDMNLTIENKFVKTGTTMMDQIDALIAQMNEEYTGDNYAVLHKKFMTELSKITYYWYKGRLITSRERSAIASASWRANVPYSMD
ncbi:hypothetical protein [Lutibacter sp.]|uniref:hypothetical protein n=1 Tax=Lutibacter sp. TaxID=1925666 RepID=UPI001A1DF040|nr:hypothetical protein [Lutibacter sp.]MBI9042684.1 hypothetical protein [Lutibacter sp.]